MSFKSYEDTIECALKGDNAVVLFRDLVDYLIEHSEEMLDWEKACDLAKNNLGYLSGNYSRENREKLEKIFNCVHPLLGPASLDLSAEETFLTGAAAMMMQKLGRKDGSIYRQPKGDPF
jgi:hypothetical protein